MCSTIIWEGLIIGILSLIYTFAYAIPWSYTYFVSNSIFFALYVCVISLIYYKINYHLQYVLFNFEYHSYYECQ